MYPGSVGASECNGLIETMKTLHCLCMIGRLAVSSAH